MTTYKTGNPIGSTAVKDLYDNAENLDVLVNDKTKETHPDRLGQQRKTWHGMEEEFVDAQADKQQRFNLLLANSGYEYLADYAAGIEVTEYNQIVRDASGEFWRASGSTVLPYTTTGAGLPESGAFISVGDAALRNELAGEPANGAGALKVRGAVIYVDTISDLQALPMSELVEGQIVRVGDGFEYKKVGGSLIPTWSSVRAHGTRNLFDRLMGTAYIRGGYIKNITDPDGEKFEVGFNVNSKVAQFRFFKDRDGLLTFRGLGYGEPVPTPLPIYALSVSGSGMNTSSSWNWYAKDVGDSFRLEVNGTNLTFRHYSDPRGGIWHFIVDGDTDNPIAVTTNSDVLGVVSGAMNEQEVFTGLEDRLHTVEAIYQGADPGSSESDDTGWFVGGARATGYVYGKMPDQVGGSISYLLRRSSINDFAIRAKATASPDPAQWIPYHGEGDGAGAASITRHIYVDGQDFGSDISSVPSDAITLNSLLVVQNYTAFSTHDVASEFPMWEGVLIHKVEAGVLTITHRIKFVQETEASGYMVMLAGPDEGVAGSLKTDSDLTLPLYGYGGDLNTGYPRTAAFFDTTGEAAMAIEVSSLDEASGLSVKQPTQSFLTRGDNNGYAKLYWPLFDFDIVPAGQEYTAQFKIALSAGVDVSVI